MYSQMARGVGAQLMKEADEIHLDFEKPWSPAMDVRLCDNEIFIYADLPGMDEDSIRVEVRNGSIYILGERHFEQEEHCEQFLQVERFYGAFEGRVSLPPQAEIQGLRKEYGAGVLRLSIPLKRE